MLRTDDFDYTLPPELIAQVPTADRGSSRMLVLQGDQPVDARFADLPEWVRPGDLFVLNDTRVMKARLFGRKPTGGQVECLVERVISPHEAWVHFRSSHAPKAGSDVLFDGGARLHVLGREGDLFHVRLEGAPDSLLDWMEASGELPLPPYIERHPDEQDEQRYQTVYARKPGAIAAPTAGLHFDEAMLERLRARGVEIATVTLHVGAGTFQPVRAEYVKDHAMHSEWYQIPQETVDAVARAKACGGRVTAVGTTSLRALEGAAALGELRAGVGETRLFITPGYRFRVVDRLFTNFHLPRSTLLMLVSAFAGMEAIRSAYRHAIAARYRFFSYGDAMLMDCRKSEAS
ncbi:MAG: tRNA preQ1(34) S-adenosylmethionine ribosyltransferase-isomerase QueA [Betaproteobacteria bacterium]|nr:tRNA preQ1(34) S-adenosylmethionine ribosyltransferase-isomerase QueA [Betaproteobacteria bacterium]MDE2622869.1 tRNA preQ1(34) S-adenosylmethionine ribosyltransferase-isomerase QueA [Betaproteobacteria bacterium]